MREAIFLAMKGVLTLDEALHVSQARRMAYCIIVRELGGENFDIRTMRWIT